MGFIFFSRVLFGKSSTRVLRFLLWGFPTKSRHKGRRLVFSLPFCFGLGRGRLGFTRKFFFFFLVLWGGEYTILNSFSVYLFEQELIFPFKMEHMEMENGKTLKKKWPNGFVLTSFWAFRCAFAAFAGLSAG